MFADNKTIKCFAGFSDGPLFFKTTNYLHNCILQAHLCLNRRSMLSTNNGFARMYEADHYVAFYIFFIICSILTLIWECAAETIFRVRRMEKMYQKMRNSSIYGNPSLMYQLSCNLGSSTNSIVQQKKPHQSRKGILRKRTSGQYILKTNALENVEFLEQQSPNSSFEKVHVIQDDTTAETIADSGRATPLTNVSDYISAGISFAKTPETPSTPAERKEHGTQLDTCSEELTEKDDVYDDCDNIGSLYVALRQALRLETETEYMKTEGVKKSETGITKTKGSVSFKNSQTKEFSDSDTPQHVLSNCNIPSVLKISSKKRIAPSSTASVSMKESVAPNPNILMKSTSSPVRVTATSASSFTKRRSSISRLRKLFRRFRSTLCRRRPKTHSTRVLSRPEQAEQLRDKLSSQLIRARSAMRNGTEKQSDIEVAKAHALSKSFAKAADLTDGPSQAQEKISSRLERLQSSIKFIMFNVDECFCDAGIRFTDGISFLWTLSNVLKNDEDLRYSSEVQYSFLRLQRALKRKEEKLQGLRQAEKTSPKDDTTSGETATMTQL